MADEDSNISHASEDKLPSPEPANTSQVTATCHCGLIAIELPFRPTKTNECRCSICYRYGAVWAYYVFDDVNVLVNVPPESELKAQSGGVITESKSKGGLSSYLRSDGDGDLTFNFCSHCGCLTHWKATNKRPTSHPMRFGVNTRMLPPSLLEEGVLRNVGEFEDFY